ncbi:hypothetical protein EV175_001057 [Coemansia sp. RSA 1933]|nr:hypothetical protein EV175_001057 [Coemansia sp. RSA 1933]
MQMEPIDTDIGVDVDMEVEPATLDVEMCDSGGGHLVRLRTLMDVDPPEDDYSEERQAVPSPPQTRKEHVRDKTRGPYRRYTPQQIERLFDLVIEEGRTAKEAALMTGINVRTAQNYVKTYREDEQGRLPGVERKPGSGRPAKLNEEHSQFLAQFVNNNPTAVLADIKKSLCDAFAGLAISESALHRHLVHKCLTDGVSVSILREITTDKVASGSGKVNGEVNSKLDCPYIEEIPSSELADTARCCVLIDPRQHDLLYRMKEMSTVKHPKLYCYTLNQKAKETCTWQFSKIREVAKKRYLDANVQAAENRLAGFCQTMVDLAKYQEYVEAQRAEWQMLSNFYVQMRTIHPKSSHPIHKELECIKCEKPKQACEPQSHLLHCKLHLSAYISQKQVDACLVQNLHRKFGEDAVLIMGNWSAPMTKFHKPIRGKGMCRMLQQQGFKVYLLDEYCMSKTCPACIEGSLTTFKCIKNPRPYQRNARPQVICHGLLSCKNEKCMEPMADGSAASPHHVRLWNQDLAAIRNFRHILNSLCENGARPAWFMHSAPKDDNDDKLLLKWLLEATDIEAAKRQCKGQAQPQP